MAFWTRLFGPKRPTTKQLLACEDVLDGLSARVDKHYAELKEIRGFVYAQERKTKRQDAPQQEISDQPDIDEGAPPARRVITTAHLSRRFKAG